MGTNPPKKRPKPTRPALGMRLGVREIEFARLYAGGGVSAAQAYRDAFDPTAAPEVVHVRAWRLLRNVHVQQLIHDLRAEALAEARVSIGYLVRGFKGAVDADVTTIFASDGTVLPLEEWPENLKKSIKRIKKKFVYELRADPDDASRKIKTVVGEEWDVTLEDKTECRRILAQFTRMIGPDAEAGKTTQAPLVIGGEADVNAL